MVSRTSWLAALVLICGTSGALPANDAGPSYELTFRLVLPNDDKSSFTVLSESGEFSISLERSAPDKKAMIDIQGTIRPTDRGDRVRVMYEVQFQMGSPSDEHRGKFSFRGSGELPLDREIRIGQINTDQVLLKITRFPD